MRRGSDVDRGPFISREALGPGVTFALSVVGFAAVSAFIVLSLDQRGIGHGPAVFSVFAATVVATRLVAGGLPDRIGAARCAVGAALIETAGLVLLGAAQDLAVVIVGAIGMGAAFSLLFPSLSLVAVDRVGPERRGAAMGTFTASFDLGMLVGSPLVGAAAAIAGYSAAFYVAAAAAPDLRRLLARHVPGGGRTHSRDSLSRWRRRDTAAAAAIDRKLINKLTEEQMARFREHTPTSAEYFDRARKVMPNGVPSSFQDNDPWPVYIERGKGAQVWDVDGNEYVDFHNGFGVMCVGHANPVIGEAVKARVDQGTHFAAPTEGSIVVAEEAGRRFGLPQWRFTNSGTESTMDAIHLARGATGRDVILKIEGSYHGHHDAVMVSVLPGARRARAARRPDAGPLRRRLSEGDHRADPAGPVQRRRRARGGARTSTRARSPG